MGFDRLRFFNFRNLHDRELSVGAREIFLVGENGQGKTNLLEAVHLLCFGSSFREKRETALMRDPSGETSIAGVFQGADPLPCTISVRFAEGKKKDIRLDEKPLADRGELLKRFLCICFVQQDMDFITGAPEARRRFFDQTLALSDSLYLDSLRKYRQILRSRNLSLHGSQEELLDVYDRQLASVGVTIQNHRGSLVRQFNEVFSPLFRDITGQESAVEIRYLPSWNHVEHEEGALARLTSARRRDVFLGSTSGGPHRDRFQFLLGGRDYSHFASTGQLRLCALVLRIAQARYLSERTGRKPLLLLDDVLLELDPRRKISFISRLPDFEQAFFTFLPGEGYEAYCGKDTAVLSVAGGDFTP